VGIYFCSKRERKEGVRERIEGRKEAEDVQSELSLSRFKYFGAVAIETSERGLGGRKYK
jgi:hypothetical protein